MQREIIEAMARAEAIRDHPLTPETCRSVITELCELLRDMNAVAGQREPLDMARARAGHPLVLIQGDR